jgi:TolA-binding protein
MKHTPLHTLTLVAMALNLIPATTFAQEGQPAEGKEPRATEKVDRRAKHLFDKAMELMQYKQYERGLAMLNTVVRDNQGGILAHRANMAMGKHFLAQNKAKESLSYFVLLTRVLAPKPGEPQAEEEKELFRESLFQAGFAQYQAGQYAAAFPMFRRLTEVAGKSKWANQAHYYIGKSHYNLKNWNKAIDALSLVGTEVVETGEKLGRVEIGQRFYAKVWDDDIPVMRMLKIPVKAQITVSSGDSEVVTAVPIAGKKNEMLASIPTEVGKPVLNDGKLQMMGGDTITSTYVDESTFEGERDVPRSGKVRAVSTGTVGFFLGDYDTPAYLAFPGQPQAMLLRDIDLDKTPGAETITVTVRSLYKQKAKEGAADSEDAMDIFAIDEDKKDQWKERDRITVTLTERGDLPVIRSGAFIGTVELAPLEDGVTPDLKDAVLHCDELDELSVTYTDDVHLYGDEPRTSEARVKVSGKVHSGVSAEQFVVFESLLKARKGSVEAEALIGLGDVYKDMGLEERAAQRADEALKKIDPIIMDRSKLPGDLVEKSFKLKWESELLKDNFEAATETCLAFNRLYPESVLADRALMTVGRTLAKKGEYKESVLIYEKVLELQNPISAAEAQYRIGETLQKQAEEIAKAAEQNNSQWGGKPARLAQLASAMAAYRRTYEAYPQSSYAADALGKIVRYYVDKESYAQAAVMLENCFDSYPDAAFLDEMLMLWAKVAYRKGDTALTKEKLRQLIFNYPQSSHVNAARSKLTRLEKKGEE